MLNEKKTRIAVLVSGGGTNLQALIDAQGSGILTHGEIAVVIANHHEVYALERAANAGIPAVSFTRKECGGQAGFEARLSETIESYGCKLVILAGFLAILSEDFTRKYDHRILNIHPSLIPSFCGEGMYGLKVHEAALARGVKVTGATVHFVNEIPDGGEIILQKAVEIAPEDTPESLQLKVMQQAEWVLLPRAAELVSARLLEQD